MAAVVLSQSLVCEYLSMLEYPALGAFCRNAVKLDDGEAGNVMVVGPDVYVYLDRTDEGGRSVNFLHWSLLLQLTGGIAWVPMDCCCVAGDVTFSVIDKSCDLDGLFQRHSWLSVVAM